jgi:hypothetical protein
VSPLAIADHLPHNFTRRYADTIARSEQQLAVLQSAPTRQVSEVELAAQAALHVRIEAQATATSAISSIAVASDLSAPWPQSPAAM